MILANRLTFYDLNYGVNDAIQRLSMLSGEEFPLSGGIAELSLFVTGSMVIASLFYMWSERRKQ